MKKGNPPQSNEFYDESYLSEVGRKYYNVRFEDSIYCNIWSRCLSVLSLHSSSKVLGLGCGTGRLARKIIEFGLQSYIGIDFSKVAIKMSKRHCHDLLGKTVRFDVQDVMELRWKDLHYSHVVATELLEHVADDLLVAKSIVSGTRVIFTVPDFICSSHVRAYKNEADIRKRFSKLISFERIEALPRLNKTVFVCAGVRR